MSGRHNLARGLVLAILAGSLGSAAGAEPISAQRAEIADGRLLAQRECSGCHAIGTDGSSPRYDAPLFRHFLGRYRADVLEDELVEGIKLGHPDMPRFQLNPKAVSGLIAYLRSIQQPGPPAVAPRKKPD